jgi:hypothetical protein
MKRVLVLSLLLGLILAAPVPALAQETLKTLRQAVGAMDA